MAFSAKDSVFYKLKLHRSEISLDSICSIGGFQRHNSLFIDSCSYVTLDNESGLFRLISNSEANKLWRFDHYVPQVIPNREMKIVDQYIYVLNSSSTLNVGEVEGAQEYYKDVRPILKFDVQNPQSSVKALGRFPTWYGESNYEVSDYQPFFCVDNKNRCVLSFAFSDSLIVIEDNTDRSISCKSSFYEKPIFLTFEEGKSLSETRRLHTESARYMNVYFNSYRNEYYRFLKHKSELGEPTIYSLIVMDYQFNILSEWSFDSAKYAPHPFILTTSGFMLPNIEVISETKKPHFEHFSM